MNECSHQTVRWTNRDRNMFILSMIETTSRGIFDHDQTKHVQNGGHAERPRVPIKNVNVNVVYSGHTLSFEIASLGMPLKYRKQDPNKITR